MTKGSEDVTSAARAYLRAGLAIYPVGYKGDPKRPACAHGLKDATDDPVSAEALFASSYTDEPGIAMACGTPSHGVVVLDGDRHDGRADGVTALEQYLHAFGIEESACFIDTTPNNGTHYFWRVPLDACPRLSSASDALMAGVDILADGHSCVLPPTAYDDGRRYVHLANGVAEIPDMPQGLLADILARLDATKKSKRSGTQRVAAPAAPAAPAERVQCGNRNHTAFVTACTLRHQGLSFEAILSVIRNLNASAFASPLSDAELESCVVSAMRYSDPSDAQASDVPASISVPPVSTPSARSASVASSSASVAAATSVDVGSDAGTPVPLTTSPTISPLFMEINGVNVSVRISRNRCTVISSVDNVKRIVSGDAALAHAVSHDSFRHADVVMQRLPWEAEGGAYPREWSNTDDAGLLSFLNVRYGMENVPRGTAAAGLQLAASSKRFNSLTDMLDGLPQWDGVQRAATLFHDVLGAEDTAYTRAATILWLRGALRRAYHPGIKFDFMLILQGAQGIGKSEILRRLAMSDEFYNDNFNTIDGDKAFEKMRGYWILEMAELLATKKTREVEALKAFITSNVDAYRTPYARLVERHPRCCVFAGTTNEDVYLYDATGARRFLPIPCGVVSPTLSMWKDPAWFSWYIQQVWAEIKETDDGAALILPQSAMVEREIICADASGDDDRIGIIEDWLTRQGAKSVCVRQLEVEALHLETSTIERRRTLLDKDIRHIMNNMPGWKKAKGTQWFNGYGSQRYWQKVR